MRSRRLLLPGVPPSLVATVRANELRRRLGIRYGRTTRGVAVPEYAVAFEVPFDSAPLEMDGLPVTDYRGRTIAKRQRMDAVAVGLWRRTEHAVHGFELKVSRADLAAELRNPQKSAPAIAHVDFWWLVIAGDAWKESDLERIPADWGVLVTHGHRLRAVRAAPLLDRPHGLDRRFVAAVLQSWMRRSPSYGLGRVAGWEDGYRRGVEQAEASAGHSIRFLERQLANAVAERDAAREQYALYGDSPGL